jgi:hypothetical protein
LTGNAGNFKIGGNMLFQPTNKPLTVTAPANAVSLQTAFNELGFGSEYNQIISGLNSASSAAAAANDQGIAPSTGLLGGLAPGLQIL